MKRFLFFALLALPHGALAQSLPDPVGTDQAPGSAAPPPIAHDRPADRYYSPAAMAAAQEAMMAHHTAPRYSAYVLDLAEVQLRKDGDTYRWEGEAWSGDLNRLLLRSRGEGRWGGALEKGEMQVAYSRAISPWWNLQAGLRQDIGAGPTHSHAMLAMEGLAPYRFDVLAALFVSDRGQVSARLETSVEERLTRRLVLQPRGEITVLAQQAQISGAEAGLRLRYEISRKVAPYVGVNWEWAAGGAGSGHAVVLGLRSWF